ncbi:MAG: HAMP domain-containing sensor histidine kinase [Bacteroidales bacterium]|nr:HAMP domain-containing sensor histidine kinase [Bacteroidales bacterium]
MNSLRIKIIIITMTMALVGLVGLQLYWIRGAITVRESYFIANVNEAVSNVLYDIEKIEFAKQMNDPSAGLSPLLLIDSLNREIIRKMEDEMTHSVKNNFDSVADVHGRISVEFYGKNNFTQVDSPVSPIFSELGTNSIELSKSLNSEVIQDSIVPLHKESLFNQVIESLLNYSHYRPIEKRINPQLLDSLLYIELKNYGIKTPYEFGIYSPVQQKLSMEKSGNFSDELMNKGMIFNLFPSDVFSEPQYLLMYFPKETEYLLKQMWVMLSASSILIISIMLLFAYTISTIIRQKKLSELKNDFINNMTHEFKTPVSTIALACEALNDQDIMNSEEQAQSYINIINDENQRLGIMAEKILQTAIMDKGEVKLKREILNVHDVLDDVIERMKLPIKSKNGIVFKDYSQTDCMIVADRFHIGNVFYNIMDNAIKYTPNNLILNIKTRIVKDGVDVYITDNGIGISKANVNKIFEKLYRVPTGNIHNVRGFGLGLNYVKNIIFLHRGNVSVDSELKKGSTFKIFLPQIDN